MLLLLNRPSVNQNLPCKVNNGNSSLTVPIFLGDPVAKADWLTTAGLPCTVELSYDDIAIKKVGAIKGICESSFRARNLHHALPASVTEASGSGLPQA